MSYSDTVSFFKEWLSDPLRVASIIPSGNALARLISREVSSATGHVLELGSGTGVFTQALLMQGVSEENLTLIEAGEEFCQMLETRFPEARILQMDACRLQQSELYKGRRVGAVISGLPLLSMSGRKVMATLAGAFCYMQPDAAFYQFTYGPRCPVPRKILDRLGLKATRVGVTYNKFPPAAVYRITKRRPVHVSLNSESTH
ncbi:SAM-dependent methyltransferase [Microvirga sp. W0021]|uniref:SAM-dependent methyltransferase n=1 Tax=Hohaiivirga grylli TaxID=3133970 RepID=A0ABV0BJU0_9HYPH